MEFKCRKCGNSAIGKNYKTYPYHTVWFCDDCGHRNVIMIKNIGKGRW